VFGGSPDGYKAWGGEPIPDNHPRCCDTWYPFSHRITILIFGIPYTKMFFTVPFDNAFRTFALMPFTVAHTLIYVRAM